MNPADKIDEQIAKCKDWHGDLLRQLRKIINEADPNNKEEWKWMTAVWTNNGLLCALGTFKNHVKINFFKGAYLKDKNKLINAGFDSKEHRAIDFYEGDKVNETALKELIKEAVVFNRQ